MSAYLRHTPEYLTLNAQFIECTDVSQSLFSDANVTGVSLKMQIDKRLAKSFKRFDLAKFDSQ